MDKQQIPDLDLCEAHIIHTDAVNAVRTAQPPQETIVAMADLFKLFSDPTRLKILTCLSKSELCVCDIAALIDMNQSAVSHQLRLLKQGHLVKSRRAGKSVFYSLADSHVITLIAQSMEHVME